VIVADQNNIGRTNGVVKLFGVEQRFVAVEGFGEFAKIFATVMRILSADFALHSRQRVQLGGAAAGSEICGRCHFCYRLSVLPDRLDFWFRDSLCSRFLEIVALPKHSLPNVLLPNHAPQNLTIATTGASGAIFLRHLLLAVEQDELIQTVNFIASDSALRVMAEELDLKGRSNLVGQLLGSRPSKKIQLQSNDDIGANVASGSYPSDAMVVMPCSVGTLARIANGVASCLIERAADVSVKEKRPLVLCVRETPLNKIHIRNMYRAADAGATIFPLIPAFYYRPASLDEMAREFAYRVLAHLGLPQPRAFHWKG
jgi:flavin prenyltransferase